MASRCVGFHPGRRHHLQMARDCGAHFDFEKQRPIVPVRA